MPSLHRAVRRARRAASRLDVRAPGPSYAYKNAEMRRVRRLGNALGFEPPVWSVNDKDASRVWVDRLGVRRARVFGEYASAADVPWSQLADQLVIKPVHGSAGEGVFLLRRAEGGGGWHDVRAGRVVSTTDVVRRLADLADAGATSRAVVAEELVEDPRHPGLPPVDYKIHTFFGRVGTVTAKAQRFDADGRPIVRWRIFDDEWNDLGHAADDHAWDSSVPLPAHPAEMLDVARRISAAVPRAFLRVDVYDDAAGVVFGEVTPEPGGDHLYRRDVDRYLGELWEDAEARVLLHCASGGVLEPATTVLPASTPGLSGPGLAPSPVARAPRGRPTAATPPPTPTAP